MDSLKKDEIKHIKRKKTNFLTRLGNRISKVFSKSKSSNISGKNGQGDVSKPSLDDMPVTSKSHDNLKTKEESFKVKRKKFGRFLKSFHLHLILTRISPKNDRCLSEGDLTRDEDKFYSAESSPKPKMGREHSEMRENDASFTNTDNSVSPIKDKRNFKNELALRLKNRGPLHSKKDDESDSSKTPDSPPGNCSGTSPSRQIFNGSRTPYSLSSLSHSSNSLSGNVPCNYPTSDGDSMSRSVIDSTDDIGVVVDLGTPLSKTTTASLLDSTAARQKIAASRPRRARPKANEHGNAKTLSSDKLKDSGKFSPVHENRDILEEISEEDSQPTSNSPTIMEDDPITNNTSNNDSSEIQNNIIDPEESSNTEDTVVTVANADKNVPSKELTDSTPQEPKVNTDHPQTHSNPDIVLPSNESDNSTDNKPLEISENNVVKFDPISISLKSNLQDEADSFINKFQKNKLKFEEADKTAKSFVFLRPANTREVIKSGSKCTSWAPTSRSPAESKTEEKIHQDDHAATKPAVNRYIPMKTTTVTKSDSDSSSHNEPKSSLTTHCLPQIISGNSTTCPDNRKSRVMDMVKNLESVPN